MELCTEATEHKFQVIDKLSDSSWRLRCTECQNVYDLELLGKEVSRDSMGNVIGHQNEGGPK